MFNPQQMQQLEVKIKTFDPLIRIVPTRFGVIKSKTPKHKVKINHTNSQEVFWEYQHAGKFQRFKLECPTVEIASILATTLEKVV